MKYMTALLVTLVSLTVVSADEPKEKTIKAELEKLQGKWEQVRTEKYDKAEDIPSNLVGVVTIEGNKWTLDSPIKGKVESTFSIDPTQDPRHWDYIRNTPDVEVRKGVTDNRIYKLDGDTLTICWNRTRGTVERPKGFKTTDGSVISVYKRVEN